MLQRRVAGQSEAGQEIAPLLLVELSFASGGWHRPLGVVVQARQLLVEVADLHALAQADFPGVRLDQSQQAPQQRRLAAAVGAQQARIAGRGRRRR